MLVIRRRVGERLVIGGDIEIEVLDAGPTQVKLGIQAPRSIAVVRKEIQVVSEQNHVAAQPIPVPGLERIAEKFKPPSPAPISPV